MDDLDLWGYQNKRVVVTGAASGMGLACVDLLNRLGADVIALDLEKPVPPVAQFVEVDMRDPRSIDSASAAIDPPAHALFNVVGIPPIRPGVEVRGASLLDIAPTVLRLAGVPVPGDLDGKPLSVMLVEPGIVSGLRVASYETLIDRKRAIVGKTPIDEEYRERLRALGYVQ